MNNEAEFERKVAICDEMDEILDGSGGYEGETGPPSIVMLLRLFLALQQRRAQSYTRLKRGFDDYMVSGVESTYQQLCTQIAVEFNDCSKQVLEIESQLLCPNYFREDLAAILRSVQAQEKKKLHLTATIQVLKKTGRPSERLVSHENCRFGKPVGHECVHIQTITEASGTEEAEADADYENALREAIKGVQDAVTVINEHVEEVRYEIAAALEDS
ncbi:unnamed protein product [Cuscuta epithymum]|uniref:Uncharacterized protein n=1 Tax=Cuscuta epithymum TaxID=186058 RepID=A0AAV0E048_9ASTE|nr:unnamed protein product [Cuscuta epithymum]CAH9128149.1 unnamed protein product [Cuscuta epithymum]